MSRKEEFIDYLKERNKDGGMSHQQWVPCLLTDIALSLAVIADALTERKEQEE